MFSKHTRFVNFEHNTMKPQDYKYTTKSNYVKF